MENTTTIDYGFDSESYVPTGDGLPAGEHLVMVSSEKRLEKEGKAPMLMLSYKALEGELKGVEQNQIYNIWNPNQTYQRLAKNDLHSISRVTNHPINGSSPLAGSHRVLRIVLVENGQYMNITHYKSEDGKLVAKAGSGKVTESSDDIPFDL